MKNLPDLEEIKYLRKKLNLSQENLGKELGLTQSTISRIENGSLDPPYSKAKAIFEFLEKERMKRKESKLIALNIMTKNIISISSDTKVKEAVDLMSEHNISQLPIIDNGTNLGSITSKKIQNLIIHNSDLMDIEVFHIKELAFPEIEQSWSLKDVSDLLVRYSAVLVADKNAYIGIITDADFLKTV
ncbi:MAG: CBS domain-containing protein [Candidatus Lokiarchaeota archaeon]|nr:CBS domain-containing protein [Candidatus Lokiarchaeota archaeon]